MKWIKKMISFIALAITAILAFLGLKQLFEKTEKVPRPKLFNKKKAEKARKEKENELENKNANDIINDLDNADDVRRTVESGRDRIHDTIRRKLHRHRSKKNDMGDNTDSR